MVTLNEKIEMLSRHFEQREAELDSIVESHDITERKLNLAFEVINDLLEQIAIPSASKFRRKLAIKSNNTTLREF